MLGTIPQADFAQYGLDLSTHASSTTKKSTKVSDDLTDLVQSSASQDIGKPERKFATDVEDLKKFVDLSIPKLPSGLRWKRRIFDDSLLSETRYILVHLRDMQLSELQTCKVLCESAYKLATEDSTDMLCSFTYALYPGVSKVSLIKLLDIGTSESTEIKQITQPESSDPDASYTRRIKTEIAAAAKWEGLDWSCDPPPPNLSFKTELDSRKTLAGRNRMKLAQLAQWEKKCRTLYANAGVFAA